MSEYVVGMPMAVLREKPGCDSQVVDEMVYGMRVTIEESYYTGWSRVCTEYGYPGYIRNAEIMAVKERDGREETVRTAFAAVYLHPDIKAPILMTLMRGSSVEVIMREGNGYTEIRLYDHRIGYMKTSALSRICPIKETALQQKAGEAQWESRMRERLVEHAMSYLHTPYRYGGKTPMGIDCSGLCFMAYYMCGIVIWRDSQLKAGYPVHQIARQDLARGDLLYFDGHVAMYIGEGRFLHATDRQGIEAVAIQSLDPQEESYRKDLATQTYRCGSIF